MCHLYHFSIYAKDSQILLMFNYRLRFNFTIFVNHDPA